MTRSKETLNGILKDVWENNRSGLSAATIQLTSAPQSCPTRWHFLSPDAASKFPFQQTEAETRQIEAELIGARFDLENTIVRAPSRGMVPCFAWQGVRTKSYQNTEGKLPSVGTTVDVEGASWTNTIGASELATIWTDPEFDPKESAFYYARVLEIRTPVWYVYDARIYGDEIPREAPTSHQERAYTSPIWYTPWAARFGLH